MPAAHFSACPDCDLLLNRALPQIGSTAHCPRCGCLLHRPRTDSVERTLALSIAGLLLLFPANFLPLVGIKVLGHEKDGTLWTGVMTLFNEHQWAVAILVFLSSILLPFINIVLCLLVSGHLHHNRRHRYLAHWLYWLQHLEEWAMLEVYCLGIIVACVKLSAMAELQFGLGLYAFVGLLFTNALLTSNLDGHLFWQRIAQLNGQHYEN